MKLVIGVILLCLGTAWSSPATPPCITDLNARGQTALMKKAIVVVDPFGFRAGELLPERIRAMGFHPIVVLSRATLPAYLLGKFDAKAPGVLVASTPKDLSAKIDEEARKAGATVVGVIPGTESGVPVADMISLFRRLPANKEAFWVRRDKAYMHHQLKEKGLAYTPSRHVKNLEDIEAFIAAELKGLYPQKRLVFKPPQSAGTDRVFMSRNAARFQHFLDAIIDKPDAFGDTYDHAVAQAELIGPEYIFDTVSTQVIRDGKMVTKHLAVGAWLYHRRPSTDPERADLIESVEWIPFEKLPQGLAKYAFEVLDALGIEFGPAHLEVMMTAQGPTLVELGARLPGGLPLVAAEAAGEEFNQIDLAIACYTDPERIARLVERHGGGYPTKQRAEIIFLSVDEEGKRKDLAALAGINKDNFSSLHDVRIFGPDDAVLPKTVDVTNALLRAHFVGSDVRVKADVEALRRKHRDHEFYLKP